MARTFPSVWSWALHGCTREVEAAHMLLITPASAAADDVITISFTDLQVAGSCAYISSNGRAVHVF